MSYVKSELLYLLMSNVLCIHCCTGFGGCREIVIPFSISSKSRIFSIVSEWPDKKGTARRQVEDFCYFMSHVINLITA